jgi:hypothetical protein
VGQTEDQMDESTIGALANLATAIVTYRGILATLTEANARLAKQLEVRSNELKEFKVLLKKIKLEERVREHATLIRKIIVGHMDTGWQESTPFKAVFTQSTGTSVRPPRITAWEEDKPTKNDV